MPDGLLRCEHMAKQESQQEPVKDSGGAETAQMPSAAAVAAPPAGRCEDVCVTHDRSGAYPGHGTGLGERPAMPADGLAAGRSGTEVRAPGPRPGWAGRQESVASENGEPVEPSEPCERPEQAEPIECAGPAVPPASFQAAGPKPGRVELEVLDPAALRRWAFRARAALAAHRPGIDALNVFPVPDGDTGTNMLHTLSGALRGLREHTAHLDGRHHHEAVPTAADHEASEPAEAPDVPQSHDTPDTPDTPDTSEASGTAATSTRSGSRWEVLARATLMSARGNSGAILSELIRGLAQTLGSARGRVDGPGLARALRIASERAWSAVGRPVEGTMLSVARGAAAAADRAALDGGRLAEVTGAAFEGAQSALAVTPEQLPTLKKAGVVDAGGAGLLVVLSALHEVVTGSTPGVMLPPRAGGAPVPRSWPDSDQVEVTYVARGLDRSAVERLHTHLDALGDSVVLAGDSDALRVHVHVPPLRASEAIDAGRRLGAIDDLRVEALTAAGDDGPGAAVPAHAMGTGSAGNAAPSRLVTLLSYGLHIEAPGRHLTLARTDAEPGDSLRAALTESDAAPIVLLTDTPERVADELEAARRDGIEVLLVAVADLPAAVAALAVHDPAAAAAADAAAMRAAAQAVTSAVVPGHGAHGAHGPLTAPRTRSAPTAPTGEAGGNGDQVESAENGLAEEAAAVVDGLLARTPGGELVTLLVRPDANVLAREVRDYLAHTHPDVEVQTLAVATDADAALTLGVE